MTGQEGPDDTAEEYCELCGHLFDPHLVIAYNTEDLSEGGEMRCPVPECRCFRTVSFDQ